jgi:alpha-galactosidase
MSGAFGYEMDLGRCSPEEKEAIRLQVETYKARYKVLHQGDYYRLCSPFQAGFCTAWEQVSPDRREALVSVVLGAAHAAPPFKTLRLKGLDPTFQYQEEGGGPLYGGEVLMEAGYPLPRVQGDYQSFQFYFRAVNVS